MVAIRSKYSSPKVEKILMNAHELDDLDEFFENLVESNATHPFSVNDLMKIWI